jgi:1-acyl-sn-glycerol-3-phosphate acyltransferase
VANDVCWWGDASFAPHLFRFLSLRGVRATVRFGEVVHGADRFELSVNARAVVSGMYQEMAAESLAGASATPDSESGAGARHQVGLVEAL